MTVQTRAQILADLALYLADNTSQDISPSDIRQRIIDIVDSSMLTAESRGLLWGLTLSNNASDATNDIDIAVGVAVDGTHSRPLSLASALTKRLDAAWAVGSGNGGLDAGAIANTTYHVWLIARSDTGVVDVLFSTSATAPTMPADYDFKRRIGSIVRSGGAIRAFIQRGDDFRWLAQASDVNSVNPGTAAVTATLTVPIGVIVQAKVGFAITDASPVASTYGLLSALETTDVAPTGPNNGTVALLNGTLSSQALADVFTDTLGRVRYRLSNSDAGVTAFLGTVGWTDTRGRFY